MAITLPPLPYDTSALEPHISRQTLEFHHGKHHASYVKEANTLIDGTDMEGRSLDDIILAAKGKAPKAKLFNNAAQCWNHDFFWKSMKPKGGGKPTGELVRRIEKDFGGQDAFAKTFAEKAKSQFGSGWAWLVADDRGALSVMATGNADLPLAHGKHALLCLDVWEHAYYLDYQNRRPDFVTAFLEHLLNWEFAATNLGSIGKLRAAA